MNNVDINRYDMSTFINFMGLNIREKIFINLNGDNMIFPQIKELILKQSEQKQRQIRKTLNTFYALKSCPYEYFAMLVNQLTEKGGLKNGQG